MNWYTDFRNKELVCHFLLPSKKKIKKISIKCQSKESTIITVNCTTLLKQGHSRVRSTAVNQLSDKSRIFTCKGEDYFT